MALEKLLGGIGRFQKDVYPEHQDLFEELALAQRPAALFITCADSRIDPNMLTQSKPGELFICRVIGNVVPPYPEAIGGISATIEYAAGVLRVPAIIICGHTDCGVINGARTPEALKDFPNVTAWLGYAETDTERNVAKQLRNLASHPSVAKRLEQGDLAVQGWVYHIAEGNVTAYDAETGQFSPI